MLLLLRRILLRLVFLLELEDWTLVWLLQFLVCALLFAWENRACSIVFTQKVLVQRSKSTLRTVLNCGLAYLFFSSLKRLYSSARSLITSAFQPTGSMKCKWASDVCTAFVFIFILFVSKKKFGAPKAVGKVTVTHLANFSSQNLYISSQHTFNLEFAFFSAFATEIKKWIKGLCLFQRPNAQFAWSK